MKLIFLNVWIFAVASAVLFGQEQTETAPTEEKAAKPAKKTPAKQAVTPKPEQPGEEASPKPQEEQKEGAGSEEMSFDMTAAAPVMTHHQIQVNGRALRYTATTGRMPIQNTNGKTEALMFYVAYTLDAEDASTRPLTIAFNGGPGAASIWLHMGALGPRKVVMQKEGFMPPAPYRFADNDSTLLDKSDLVLVDAIGTGFSRPANAAAAKKYWSVKGDIEAFSEFIRMYLTRNNRWSSPLFLFGESYGTTRAAGVAGYLADKGISFNGIVLLSTILSFQTAEANKSNDLPFPLLVPTYAMIAAYHHKLAPELNQNLEKTRAEAEHWAMNEYSPALTKGDALSAQERQSAIDGLAKYTGLGKEYIDQANLRVDVDVFTHYLLADQKLRVGRLDGRFSGPDPEGFIGNRFSDPTSSQTEPPFTSAFNDYVRRELNYKTDMRYYVSGYSEWGGAFKWDWGSAVEGFPDTATALRQAMVKNPYLKVRVLEGYYDLATPYFAVNYTMDHLNLSQKYRDNISYGTFLSGHMVYLDSDSLKRLKTDVSHFMDQAYGSTK